MASLYIRKNSKLLILEYRFACLANFFTPNNFFFSFYSFDEIVYYRRWHLMEKFQRLAVEKLTGVKLGNVQIKFRAFSISVSALFVPAARKMTTILFDIKTRREKISEPEENY